NSAAPRTSSSRRRSTGSRARPCSSARPQSSARPRSTRPTERGTPRPPQDARARHGRFPFQAPALAMTDDDFLRYSRHLLLDDIGIEGQQRLLSAHALVIGAGGLGSPVALYLGSAGVGRITLVDHDTVDLTTLQRQIAHNLARLGQPKAQSAQQAIAAINPEPQVRAVVARADA